MLRYFSTILIFVLLVLATFSNLASAQPREIERILTIEPLADSYVDQRSANLNFGGSRFLEVSLINGQRETSFLRFDIPAIDNSSFISADLNLYLRKKTTEVTSSIGVYIVDPSSWDELRITYVNAPILDSLIAVNSTIAFEDTWYTWNVASAIVSRADTGGGEITFALLSLIAGGDNTFYSKDSELEPYIEIRFIDSESVSDDLPPLFGEVWFLPESPTVEDPIEIFVEVSDEDPGVGDVFLHHIKDTDRNWSIDRMREVQNGVYVKELPRQASNSTLFFFVEAEDFVGNTVTTDVYFFNVTRPLYHLALVDELNMTISYYESLLANTTLDFEMRQSVSAALFEAELDRLLSDLEELRTDYEELLVDRSRLGRERDDLNARYDRVQSLYNELKSQYSSIELAYVGQQEKEADLKLRLENLQSSFNDLVGLHDNSLAQLDRQDQQANTYFIIAVSVASGFGLLAIASFSLWYFGRIPTRGPHSLSLMPT